LPFIVSPYLSIKGIRVRVWRRIAIKGSENENKGYASFVPVGRKTAPDKFLRTRMLSTCSIKERTMVNRPAENFLSTNINGSGGFYFEKQPD
jgi:hypothetical protein